MKNQEPMKFFKTCFVLGMALLCFSLAGCSKNEKKPCPDYVLKTRFIIVTPHDFSEELDLKKAGYPYHITEDPEAYNEMVMSLADDLSQEIVLLSAAMDKGITVSDQQLEDAVEKFKQDYPADSFNQILLENAISYDFWKKRFRKDMIIDRLIDRDLRKKINISSDDIVEFYKNHMASSAGKSGKLNRLEQEKQLVSSLRREKAQDQYETWLAGLEKQYPVEIDMKQLKHFLMGINKFKGNENEKEN
jgi:uncharacterized protein (DUF885 family)